MSRVELLRFAQRLNVNDADVMTRPELRSAIQGVQNSQTRTHQAPATWLGVARRLVASVIEQGLNLPEAASLVRGDTSLGDAPAAVAPVATVTLARIYAAQGHVQRAVDTLQTVLDSEPDHDPARSLSERLQEKLSQDTGKPGGQLRSNPAASPYKSDDSVEAARAAAADDAQALPEPEVTALPPPVQPLAAPEEPAVQKPAAPAAKEPASVAEPLLVLMSTAEDDLFAYWEGAPDAGLQLTLVAHGVSGAEGGRQERRFELEEPTGMLELSGVDPKWILRGLLRTTDGPGRIVAVAGCVHTDTASVTGALGIDYSPHAGAIPRGVALRAREYQATAPVVTW